MKRYDLLLINPPSLLERPDVGYGGGLISHTEVSKKIRVAAMNPGLLSIASEAASRGYNVSIVDLSNDTSFKQLAAALRNGDFRIIGVSSTSGFDYVEALECVRIAKQHHPGSTTIVGGQHAGPLGVQTLADSPFLDMVCLYEGEYVINRLLDGDPVEAIDGIAFRTGGAFRTNAGFPESIPLSKIAPFDFTLYPNYSDYAPLIEESRGCYAGCGYCTSTHMNRGQIRTKPVEMIVEQLADAVRLWGEDELYILSAATFGVSERHMLELADSIKGLGIRWTTEFRVDTSWCKHIDALYESGLRIAVVGVESASPEVLLRMNKTKNPEAYIRSTERVIEACRQCEGLTLRLNMMFYVGETPATIRETLSFLAKNSDGIDALLYTPIFVNPGTRLSQEFERYERNHGATLIRSPYWDARHLHLCHPSRYFSLEESLHYCDMMEKLFSSEKGWIESERFHYTGIEDDEILKHRFNRR